MPLFVCRIIELFIKFCKFVANISCVAFWPGFCAKMMTWVFPKEINMNTTLKQLAKRARNRLKTAGEYSADKDKTAYLSATSSYIMVANIRRIEDDPLFGKIKKVLEKSRADLVINPLSHLIDNRYFNSLTSEEKEKYILKLTKRFNAIKDYILDNNLLENCEEENIKD